jgi:Arc/MetJ-type ribon-helix-helix transcriptional regulator
MKEITVRLPDKVAEQLDEALESGWFLTQDDLIRAALVEFLNENRLKLIDQQQLEDIEWVRKLANEKRAG